MFYFDSNTTVPLQCVALVFWKGWLTVPWDLNKIILARFNFTKTMVAFILYLFLFHIVCTIYAYHVFIKTTIFNKRYRTHYKI